VRNALTVRDMSPTDFPEVLAIASGLDGIRMQPDEDQQWHDQFIRRNGGLCLVGEWDRAVVAFVYCGNDGRRATVYHLGVAPNHQGAGIGSAILTELERRIRGAGVARALLMVLQTNPKAVGYYVKHGWRVRDDLLLLSKDM
jgi:ribosomal protein S18 acetylase RimI-like enzyme